MPIYRKTRLHRRGDILERLLDAAIGPLLQANGFAERLPLLFGRRWDGGEDIVFLNIEPRWFSINVATNPDGMNEIYDLYYDDENMRRKIDFGLCGDQVLTPAGVFGTHRSDCTFKTRNAAERNKSIDRARQAFADHAADWFASMRDPVKFAASMQPTALMLLGRAHELAGNSAGARQAYAEMFARLCSVIEYSGSLQKFATIGVGVREFVYLCRKLRVRMAEGAEVEVLISYFPKVIPLD